MFGRTSACCARWQHCKSVADRSAQLRANDGAITEHTVRKIGYTSIDLGIYAAVRHWAALALRTFPADPLPN